MVFRRCAPLEPFRILPLEGAILDPPICADPSDWEVIRNGSYWGRAELDFVLKSGFSVPSDWRADRLALRLPLGVLGDIFNHPEALAYIDRKPIGSADRYHHTLPLAAGFADGRRHVISLHGWTGHAGWPPDPESTARLHMGNCALVEVDPDTRDFSRLAAVAFDALNVIEDPSIAEAVLDALDTAFLTLDTRDPLGEGFYDSVADARVALQDGKAPSAWTQISMAIRLGFLLGRGFSRAAQLNETMEANHYREPHWYLAILGVEPDAQGRGLGAQLMQPLLDRCDTDGTDAYLESSKESNIPFYQRFGFEVTGELKVPGRPDALAHAAKALIAAALARVAAARVRVPDRFRAVALEAPGPLPRRSGSSARPGTLWGSEMLLQPIR